MSELLEVEALETGYGRIRILHGVSLATTGGRNIGLFGPNGHGKTTLLRALSGLLPTWRGAIRFDGANITKLPARKIVELGLIHVPQGNRLFPDLTIRESLRLGAWPRRARANEARNLERAVAIFPKLGERWSQQVRTLSGGERQMVSIAVALMGEPRLLVLDEPTLGLAPKLRATLAKAIHEIAATGVGLLVVDQDIDMLLGLCDRLYLIEQGRVALDVTDKSAIQHKDVLARYFGSAA